MKLKYTVAALAMVLPSLAFGVVHAENIRASLQGEDNTKGDTNIEVNAKLDTRAEKNGQNQQMDQGDKNDNQNGTSSEMTDKNASSTNDGEDKGMLKEHHTAVAGFVHSLLQVADREGEIGAEVRAVAHTQDESATTTESAMEKVEAKGNLEKFFFGSDYKNLGIIRNELATTTNDIVHLQALLASTTNATDKATLSAQIQVLQTEHDKVNAYITAHEDAFSLFGWFTRFFSN